MAIVPIHSVMTSSQQQYHFKLRLQQNLLNNTAQLDYSGKTIQHLTNILVLLTTVANIHRDIQVSNSSLKPYSIPSCVIINRIVPVLMYKTA